MKNLTSKLLAFTLPIFVISCGGATDQQAKIEKLEQEVARLAAAQNAERPVAASAPTPENDEEIYDLEGDSPTEDNYFYDVQEAESQEAPQNYATISSDWDYPHASSRLLTDNELSNTSTYNLRIMRNEIFARYGYIFKSPDLQSYFAQKRNYSPRYSDVVSYLTATEKQNIEKIKKYEKLNMNSVR